MLVAVKRRKIQFNVKSVGMLKFTQIISLFIIFNLCLTVKAQTTIVKVIPEVKSFTQKKGIFTFGESTKILVENSNKIILLPIAQQLKDELAYIGISATIEQTNLNKASSKNILLKKYTENTENDEAYDVDIDEGITILGKSKIGIFWGTRTLFQLIENHKNEIPKGLIIDFPDYPSRGFMIDVARKFFSIDFLKHYIKFMSYYKMNELHIHLNDNGFKKYFENDWAKTYAAFRLESTTYPELTAKDGHYTKEEFRDLQLLGQKYGVNVIPEIDIPAHSLAFTRYNLELQASHPYGADHLDILNDEKLPMIYNFFDCLFDEYLDGNNPVFIGKDVHIGTDEFVKEGDIYNVDNKQAKRFREFTQHYIDYIFQKGKRPRLWGGLRWLKDNPETQVIAKGGAIMNAWSKDWVNPNDITKKGFKIISSPDNWLYIVPKAGYYRDFLDIKDLYKNYTPRKVNKSEYLEEKSPSLLGASFAVWNDVVGNGISQLDVHYRVLPAMKVMATKTWNTQPKRNWEDYEKLSKQTSEGIGLNLVGKYSKKECSLISKKVGEKSVSFTGKNELKLGAGDIGYDYEVSFDIKIAENNTKNAILFQSNYGKILINVNGSKQLGFARDGYVYVFDYKLIDKWQRVKLIGKYDSLILYINGKLIQKLKEKQKGEIKFFQQTLCFPVEKIGDKNNGFVGEIKKLNISYLE